MHIKKKLSLVKPLPWSMWWGLYRIISISEHALKGQNSCHISMKSCRTLSSELASSHYIEVNIFSGLRDIIVNVNLKT